MLLLQFFIVPNSEAKVPAPFWGKEVKKEASFSRMVTLPVGEGVHQDTGISTATQVRRHLASGGLMVPPIFLSRTTPVGMSSTVQRKESFCFPIALRLLFPGHYFW